MSYEGIWKNHHMRAEKRICRRIFKFFSPYNVGVSMSSSDNNTENRNRQNYFSKKIIFKNSSKGNDETWKKSRNTCEFSSIFSDANAHLWTLSLAPSLWTPAASAKWISLAAAACWWIAPVGVGLHVRRKWALGIHHIHYSLGRSALDANVQPAAAPAAEGKAGGGLSIHYSLFTRRKTWRSHCLRKKKSGLIVLTICR